MRAVVIANPASSGGKVGRNWKTIEQTLVRHLGPVDVQHTQSLGHATRLTRDALRSATDLIVAVGGDGTFSEVVDGFFDDTAPIRPSAALGLIPFGTGGDFRRTAGIPNQLEAAVQHLRDHEPRWIDVGRLQYVDHDGHTRLRHFLNITSFGLGGLVDSIVNQSSKALGGKVAFYLGTVRALLKYRHQAVRIRLDDAEPREQRILTVAVANGRFFGGGMQIAPEAVIDDGMFDVIELGDFGLMDFVLKSGQVRAGTHLQMEQVRHRRARRVTAEAVDAANDGGPVLLDVDGEQPGRLPATFEVVPKSLRLQG
jgi:YegS/Rv2252/BmrU family lipid kinase